MGSAVVKSVIRYSEILDSFFDMTMQSLHSDGQETETTGVTCSFGMPLVLL